MRWLIFLKYPSVSIGVYPVKLTLRKPLHYLPMRAYSPRSVRFRQLNSAVLVVVVVMLFWTPFCLAVGTSLRFFGNGINAIDRVKIRIDDPANADPGPPVDVGGEDFTIEFWIKGLIGENTAPVQTCGNNLTWINGNIVLDRDRYGQDRKFGISIGGGQAVFGVSGDGTGDFTICGTSSVLDDTWHHIAVQRRRSDGWMWLYVDGLLDAEGDGPDGDVSYPDDGIPGDFCGGPCTDSDPFIVIGAEKHDAGPAFPSFSGFVDELRLSKVLRYAGNFRPAHVPFLTDHDTVGLYHFDSAGGNVVVDASRNANGASHGERRFGGTPVGPVWSTDTPPFSAPSQAGIELVTAGLNSPVAVASPRDGSNRLFIVEQRGVIRIFDLNAGVLLATPFLDISDRVDDTGNEQGLLGLAFGPDYANNGLFFVNYTRDPGSGLDRTVVARYSVSTGDPNIADTSETKLFEVEQLSANHNGGDMHFGPDGFLYIAMGDGGGGGDPGCNGQRLDTLLGALLRIDPNGTPPSQPNDLCGLNSQAYEIPADNPFSGGIGDCDEIWAYGLRNPWRFSFDRLLGDMFIGDVGQGVREEIDFQSQSSVGGENYGWNREEGTLCYTGTNNPDVNSMCPAGIAACGDPGYAQPVMDYAHSGGNCSVTGGYRYRGRRAPNLFGAYFFGDFCTGRIWQGRPDDNDAWSMVPFRDTDFLITSFGEDERGEIYILNRTGAGGGELHRILSHTFVDVPPTHPFWRLVESSVQARLMNGCDTTTFCGGAVLARRQLAAALLRARDGADANPAAASGIFSDVSADDVDARFIERLFTDGIAEGCDTGPDRFCPDAVMTRGDIAPWLVRAIHGASFVPSGASGQFDDVDVSDPFAPYAEQLLADGVIEGCTTVPLHFCPDQVVTKFQAAAMLARGFQLPLP